jgi:hypothetical protein
VVEVKIYRAGSESEKGVKAFSSWSEDRSTAEAYLDNQGFGGLVLRSAVIHPNNVLDADTTNRRGMVKLAQSLGFDPSEGEEWFDAGWRYPWEESKRVKGAASSSAFDAIRYVDDFPEGALTIITTRDFKPEEEERLNPRQLMGININDSTQDFTGQILRGEKTIETRSTRSLDPYIDKRVGIIRTGVGKATLVGYATVGELVFYDSVAKFRRDQSKHLVAPGSAFDIKDRLRYGYPLMQVEAVEPKEIESRGIVARRLNPYTKPDLRERLKRKVMAGNKGGGWGQWSARKAQLLAAEYEKAGGGYTGKRSASQKSLSKWSQQDWRTKSGKPSSQTGERYLPAKAIEGLTAAEYAATTRAKRKATGQFSRQPKRIAMKTKEFRNPMDPRSMVDEAARAAGYTTKAFHRTSSKFTKFIPGGPNATREIWKTKSGESRTLFGQSGRAMWFGTSPDNLPAYHNEPTGKGVVLMVYLKNPSPLQVDDDTRDWARDLYGDGSKNFPLLLSDEHIKSIRDDGYTGIEYWQNGKTADKSDPDEIVVFDANQIKSADLVTYDDADNAIPISNRFNGKSDDIRNPVTPSIRKKLASVIEKDDRILCYDTATDEDFYRLWDIIHTDLMLNKESLREIEGMLDDDGVLVIESGETPAGLQDHFRKATRYQGLLLVQGPLEPEQARIETEKLRRDLE